MVLIAILCFYTAIFSLVSYIQIQFLEKQKFNKALVLDDETYKDAANIAIENEKFKIFSNFYTLIINILWLTFGLLYLKKFIISSNSILENTLFLLLFLLITSLLNLPLSLYENFVKNKKQGFSNMTLMLFIKDSVKSLILFVIFGFLILYALLF
ncbi:M48 family peptidase, partial [Campylobacter sp. TTU-622]|nr:M48 family peptidase [Campylobacter sp. TTU-622]